MSKSRFCTTFLIFVNLTILLSSSSCNFIQKVTDLQNIEQNQANYKKSFTWHQIKDRLLVDELDGETLNTLLIASKQGNFIVQDNEIDEVVRVMNASKNPEVRVSLFKVIASFVKKEPKLLSLFRDMAASEDRLLAPEALNLLIDLETSKNTIGQDQWENWQWSREVKDSLEKAVDKDLYKLSVIGSSDLGPLKLLRLAIHYPNSKFTEGARAYRILTGGKPYLGPYTDLPSDKVPPELRIPFDPKRELEIWTDFLVEYPDHPATDDVTYRIARAYEMQGEYEKALILYYKASQMPDRALSGVAKSRVLLISDLLMNVKSLAGLLKTNSYQELVPILEYSRAIHLVREGNIPEAIFELRKFINSYENKTVKGFFSVPQKGESNYIFSKSNFWRNVKRQVENLEKLNNIKRKPISDQRLYEEASFWFHNDLTAYNYFWRGGQTSTFAGSSPVKRNKDDGSFAVEWEGSSTSTQRVLSYGFVEGLGKEYDSQNGSLISVALLKELLRNYPNSSLAEKAKFSVILNYYWLNQERWVISLNQSDRWTRNSVKNAYEFVEKYPRSSMADDALLTIGEIGNPLERVKALEKLFRDYPNSDRKKSAESLLKTAKSDLANSKREDGIVVIGFQMDERKSGWFDIGSEVFITGIIPNSSASRSGLFIGDVILEVDGRSVSKSADVQAVVRSHTPGEIVKLKVKRNENTLSISATAELMRK